MQFFHPRSLLLFSSLTCFALVLIAAYVEPFASMDPCPMCMMQRAVFILLGSVLLLTFLHYPKALGLTIYGIVASVFGLLGMGVAGRQIWLQHLPEDQVPACGPGMDYMLEVFPLLEVIELALRGTGDCAKVQWTFMSLSIPGWSFVAFAVMTIFALYLTFAAKSLRNI